MNRTAQQASWTNNVVLPDQLVEGCLFFHELLARLVTTEVLGTWEHRGNVELYFKHRYRDFNYKIGTLTEYFKFDNVNPVLLDLRQMKPKLLTQAEVDILSIQLNSDQ